MTMLHAELLVLNFN